MTSGAIRVVDNVLNNLILCTICAVKTLENSSLVGFTLESSSALSALSAKREIVSRN